MEDDNGECATTMERAAGIEPACLAWKARALPLSYARFRQSNYALNPTHRKDFLGFWRDLFRRSKRIKAMWERAWNRPNKPQNGGYFN